MSLDLDEVRKISRLARLSPVRLSPDDSGDEAAMVRDLSAIVGYFDQLSDYEADPEPGPEQAGPEQVGAEQTGAEQISAGAEASSREAVDQTGECLDRRLFEANAPEARDGFLVVPRITAGAAKA